MRDATVGHLVAAVLVVGIGLVAARAEAASETGTLTSRVEVVSTCTVEDADIDFGTYVSGQQADLDATAVIRVSECPVGSVRIALDGGGSGNVKKRQMRDGSGNTLNYQLYTDSNRRTVFNGNQTVQLDAQGNGSITVYGRIPGGQVVPEGSYSDTVRVTMTF